MKKGKNTNKGITLIALVITIIVLLILAGVSIAMLTGQSGILTQAQNAKKQTEYSTAEEKVELAVMGGRNNRGNLMADKVADEIKNQGGTLENNEFPLLAKMDNYNFIINENGKVTSYKAISEITGTENENTVTLDSTKKNQVVVPAGFKVVNPSATVQDGIIVEDVSHSATKGSQFVWIPVGTINKNDGSTAEINLERYTVVWGNKQIASNPTDQLISSPSGSQYYWETLKDKAENSIANAKDIIDFKSRAESSHGYYVGRYEARVTTERQIGSDKPSQITENSNDYVYNYVTQNTASELSQKMYSDSNFESDLINSMAWDTAMTYLDKCSGNSNYSSSALNNSYSNKGTTTDVVCNIYDMAGNYREQTTENCKTGYWVTRKALERSATQVPSQSNLNGESFRPILYL